MKNNEKVIQQRIWIFPHLNEREIENRWKNESGKINWKNLGKLKEMCGKHALYFLLIKLKTLYQKLYFYCMR